MSALVVENKLFDMIMALSLPAKALASLGDRLCEAARMMAINVPVAPNFAVDVTPAESCTLSDKEMDALLASRPVFDETKYREPSDEDWKIIVTQRNGRLTKGLEKWL